MPSIIWRGLRRKRTSFCRRQFSFSPWCTARLHNPRTAPASPGPQNRQSPLAPLAVFLCFVLKNFARLGRVSYSHCTWPIQVLPRRSGPFGGNFVGPSVLFNAAALIRREDDHVRRVGSADCLGHHSRRAALHANRATISSPAVKPTWSALTEQ